MIQNEVTEIKKIMTKNDCCIHGLAGCYVDANKEMHILEQGKFLVLQEEEQHKYFDLIKKGLSGRIGKNLLNLVFRTENGVAVPNRDTLMQVLNSELKEPQVLQAYFEKIRDSYAYVDNYYIMLVYGVYDVPGKTADGIEMEDASDVVYKFNLTLLCPLKPSKAGLMYNPVDNSLENAMRNMMVEMPMNGFLFPAFNDRSTDIHSTLFYTKNTKEPHSEFMANGLGCGIERTATEQKMAFHSIVRNVLGAEDEHTDDVLLDLQQNLSDMIDEYAETHNDDEDVFLLDKEVVTKLLADSEISEEKAAKIEKSVDEAFGEKPPAAENVIDSKALVQNELRVEKMALEDQVGTLTVQLNEKDEALAERTSQLIEKQEEIDNYIAETKTYDVVLRVKPEKASQIKSQVINGQKCLVIPMGEDEHATINGVNTTV